jgi:hypothetical protein
MNKFTKWYSGFSNSDKMWHVAIILSMFIFPYVWLFILMSLISFSIGMGIVWLLRQIP